MTIPEKILEVVAFTLVVGFYLIYWTVFCGLILGGSLMFAWGLAGILAGASA